MGSSCVVMNWSTATREAFQPAFYVCCVALFIHLIFWIQLICYPSVRQRNMMWLYAYLITDMLILFRFFVLYGLRHSAPCVPNVLRDILCYFEATVNIYLNVVECYLLLALNVCRYLQIVRNRNVYETHRQMIFFVHVLIYTLPVFNMIVQFVANWSEVWRKEGGSCDIRYLSLIVQLFNLFVVYIIPVILNLIFLFLSLRHVRSTEGIQAQQIIDARQKRHRTMLIQSIIFYSVWLLLWSPNLLSYQFTEVTSDAGLITALLNYIEIALDPGIIAALDVRFLKAWRKTWNKIKARRQPQIAPLA